MPESLKNFSTFLITNQVRRCHWKKKKKKKKKEKDRKSWVMGLVHNDCRSIIKFPLPYSTSSSTLPRCFVSVSAPRALPAAVRDVISFPRPSHLFSLHFAVIYTCHLARFNKHAMNQIKTITKERHVDKASIRR